MGFSRARSKNRTIQGFAGRREISVRVLSRLFLRELCDTMGEQRFQKGLGLGLLLPRLYVILDAGLIRGRVQVVAQQLMDAGVRLLQYRAKNIAVREMLETAERLTAM